MAAAIVGESALFYASFVRPVNDSFNDTLRLCVHLRVAVLLGLVPVFARARPAFPTYRAAGDADA